MTVVPADHLMTLICDGCGDTITGTPCVLPDAEVVWTLVFDNGWVGSPFASGPHHCPRCSLPPEERGSTGDGVGESTGETDLGIDYLDEVDDDQGGRDIDADQAVRRALAEVIDLGDRIVVDLTEVEVIDSTGLGLLVRAHREARQRGGVLCLVGPSRFVLTVLHTMRLDGVFPIFESRAAALRGLADPAAAPVAHGPAAAVVHDLS